MRWLVLAFAVVATPAGAACTWTWDCTTGTCRQVSVCQNTLDIPPPRPPSIKPIPSPTIKPLPSLALPPIGTKQCSQRYLCNFGQCSWQTVCQ